MYYYYFFFLRNLTHRLLLILHYWHLFSENAVIKGMFQIIKENGKINC